MAHTLRVLALTKIFPNRNTPHAMPTIWRQCVAMKRFCELDVWATIPWFPPTSLLKKRRHETESAVSIPRKDNLFGLEVEHPRTVYVPGLPVLSGAGYALSIASQLTRYRNQFDVILSTWAYPDGVAAIALSRLLRIPAVVQVIGSDIDVVAQMPSVRPQVNYLFPKAAGIIAVSSALAQQCVELGARREVTEVIITGVDRNVFAPRSQEAARQAVGLPSTCKVILYVGKLSEAKGALDALLAFEQLKRTEDTRLVFIGTGPLLERLRQRASERSDLILKGSLDGPQVAQWIAACDLLTLPSYHEGTPNVILEALSSGRPVVATRVGGVPDVCTSTEYGELVSPGAIDDLASAYAKVLARKFDPETIAACPSLYSWEENAKRVLKFLQMARGSAAVPPIERTPS